MIGLAIRRPVAVTMAYLAIAVLGCAAWRTVPLELLPDTQLPQLTIRSQWPGASPEAVEAFVTSPLEAVAQQVSGVESVSSTSQAGVADIRIEFGRRTNMNFARLELSERLSGLVERLPPRVRAEVIPYVPREIQQQQRAFLEYSVTGPYTPEALRAHVQDMIRPEIMRVEGVSAVEVHGGRERLLEIALDPARIEALGLSVGAVQRHIHELEVVKPAGTADVGGSLRTVAIRQWSESLADLLQLAVLTDRGRIVRLKDVARIHDTYDDARQYYRIDGSPAVSFTLHKQMGTNVLAVADAVKARLSVMAGGHPPGLRLILDEDESQAVKAQLSALRSRAIAAVVVIFCVLLLFLGSIRSAGIVVATIAFSVLITVNWIYFGGLTLNVLTLMGLAMGFGLVVDNAIVVLENIHRRWKLGHSPATAAELAAREVFLPILAATLTTMVGLIPFVYLQGELQVYYVPLALVVGFCLGASLLVAFSFIPALASRLLPAGPPADRREAVTWYARAYVSILRLTLRRPVVTVVLALSLLAASYETFDRHVTRDVLWADWWGRDAYIDIQIRMPQGDEIGRVDRVTRTVEERLEQMPEVERFVTTVYPSFSRTRVTFPDSLESTDIPAAIKEQLRAYGHRFGGLDVRVYGYGPSFYGTGSPPSYSVRILGYDYGTVREIAEDLGERLTRSSRIREVDTNSGGGRASDRETELVLALDRERLALHGLSARDVVREVAAATQGPARNRLRLAGEDVRLAVKLAGSRDLDLLELQTLPVPSATGSTARLGDVTRLYERTVPGRIEREDQRYSRFVTYEFRGPPKLGERVQQAAMANTFLPPGYSIDKGDQWRWRDEEKRQIFGVLSLSVLLVFMVTAALLESLRQPLTVLLTVPMALMGVFLIFSCTGASFTREAYIGVVMMAGIVVNNAILLVDHLNRLRRVEGLSLESAALRGTLERVRPIVMTSATTVLGLLPLVLFSASANENIWNPMAYALIGGLASSTVLVLTVTPALYLLVERAPERRRRLTTHPQSQERSCGSGM